MTTTAFVAIAVANPEVIMWQIKNMGMFYFMIVLSLIAECCIICNRDLGRTVPINYALLGVVTVGQSYCLSMICAFYTPESVFMVLLVTTLSFVAMSLYAINTTTDLTIFGSVLAGASMAMVAMAMILMFTNCPVLRMIYDLIGTVLALLFVAVDTQMIFNEKKHGIEFDDYILAAMMIYLDFI